MKNKFFTLNKFLILFFLSFFSTIIFINKFSFAVDNSDMSNRIYDMEYRSFFIGNIVDEYDEKFKIKVTTIFLGEDLKEIEVSKFKEYSYSNLVPTKGDFFVGILKKDNTLDLNWIFKATSGNYETLYLANDKDPNNEEIKLFQNMINNGEYIPNLTEIERYKKIEENKHSKNKYDFSKNYDELTDEEKENRIKSFNEKSEKEYQQRLEYIFKLIKNPFVLIVPVILFLLIFYSIRSRKKFLKEMEERIDEHDYEE